MLVNFSRIDFKERPILILKNAAGSPIATLGYAFNVSADLRFNETSTLQFTVPAYIDGKPTPGYNEIEGLRHVELFGVGEFKLVNPVETGEGVKITKQCKAYSLEYEFALKKITIPNSTYCFWKTVGDQSGTLLGMIMKEMPSWRVGKVSSTLLNRYRTFEAENENIYNFIKGTVQKSYNCIFDFDTLNRIVNVIDVADEIDYLPVYLSPDNLAKKIEIEEDVEGVVTRLDVNGAEGVNIRNVNPDGTNRIITLDYYMNTTNFSQEIIDKYFAWKQRHSSSQQTYYTLAMRYTLLISQNVSAGVQMTELKNELVVIENELAVTLQAMAQNLEGITQETVDAINERIAIKQAEIDEHQAYIDGIEADIDSIREQLVQINVECKFESAFTEDELLILDRYIKDDDITETSFVATNVDSFSTDSVSNNISGINVVIDDANIYYGKNASEKIMRNARAGTITVGEGYNGQLISAVIETNSDNSVLMNVRLGECTVNGKTYPGGMLTVNGKFSDLISELNEANELDPEFWVEETKLEISIDSAHLYFTLDTSDYEKYSVAWDLYEYGLEVAERLAQPAYTFSLTSANFLSNATFQSFRDALAFGRRVYIENCHSNVLTPICIAAAFTYENPDSLTLKFGDSYLATDSAFKMVDLLDQSISMGKSVDVSKYTYSAFVDSGASTGIRNLMDSALDVSKNAIMSSTDQAISWDGAGLRLRKWANDARTAYEPEQVWMNNNSVMLTSNGWKTAQMAIGKFYDENVGECWGIIAPHLVGTLLAGSNLIIESEKKDGGTAVFKVDGDGCQLYNSKFVLNNGNTEILLNPDDGIAIGKAPLYVENEDGEMELSTGDDGNAKLWIDEEGNIHIRGTLHGVDGTFDGMLNAETLQIINGDSVTTIGEYISFSVSGDIETAIKVESEKINATIEDKINGVTTEFTATTDEIKQSVQENTGKIAELTVKSDEISASVTETQENVDGLTNRIESAEAQLEPGQLKITVSTIIDDVLPESDVYDNLKVHIGNEPPTDDVSEGKLWVNTSVDPEEWNRYEIDEEGNGGWVIINSQAGLEAQYNDMAVHIGSTEPSANEDGVWPDGKLWVDTSKDPEEWKRYNAVSGQWVVISSQEEIAQLQQQLLADHNDFKTKVETWFTFDNERGLIIQKPQYTDDDGTVCPGSPYYTVTDNTGYHIGNTELDGYLASFEYDRMIVQRIQVGKTIMRSTSTGGVAWRCNATT